MGEPSHQYGLGHSEREYLCIFLRHDRDHTGDIGLAPFPQGETAQPYIAFACRQEA